MSWSYAGESVSDPLQAARPGLEHDGGLVSKERFHRLIALAGVRLLTIYVEVGTTADHEIDWITRSIVAIDATAALPRDLEEGSLEGLYPGGALGLMATMNTLTALHGATKPDLMGQIAQWVRDAHGWACKRHIQDRFCRTDCSELFSRAVALHGAFAERQGGDPEAAEAVEQQCVRDQLLGGLPPLSG